MSIVKVDKLRISVLSTGKTLVNDISFDLIAGSVTGLVGESGSGKSLTALSLMQLLPKSLKVNGEISFNTKETSRKLNKLTEKELIHFRGNTAAMIFQDPMSSLNPSQKVGNQVREAFLLHHKTRKKEAHERVMEMFEKVLLPNPERIFNSYPFQLSGGQRQRVMIAMALINDPELLIADEATTALDVTVQHEIIELIKSLQKELNLTVLFITHDLALLNNFAEYVMVMKDGDIVEQGINQKIVTSPKHDYTHGLLACRPTYKHREFVLPVIEQISTHVPIRLEKRHWPTISDQKLIDGQAIDVHYQQSGSKTFKALSDVHFSLRQGETLGVVGESGSGKTTLSKAILQLIPYSGQIYLDGQPIGYRNRKKELMFRKKIQFVFQDPYASLNPVMKIGTMLNEILKVHRRANNQKSRALLVKELLGQVDLPDYFAERYPHELSGGQRQRVAIAKALAPGPDILILDEAVAALDVSVQAKVLNLLNTLKSKFGLSYIFISHDLEVVHYMSDRIIVMKDGVIEESGDADQIFRDAQSTYTKKLIEASPSVKENGSAKA